MDGRRTWIAGICIMSAVGVAWAGDWFAHRLIPVSYPGALAYKPSEDLPPVDLASVQRGWPDSLGTQGERSRLIAWLHDMERQGPAPVERTESVEVAVVDFGTLLASADVDVGKGKARVCMTCHDFDRGGPDRLGPNLWNVVGRDIAARRGFAYSAAMAGQQGAWSVDRLDSYLASPARAMPGTKMSFTGLRRPEDRAAVIRYLVSLSDRPQALPAHQAGAAVGQ